MTESTLRIIDNIKSLNPGIDTLGPIYDIIANPIGTEIDNLDIRIDAMKNLFSSGFDITRSSSEVEMIAATHGVIRDLGSKAIGNIIFRFINVPSTINIPAGTEISTSNSLYQFTITEDVAPNVIEANSSLNPSSGLYEINVPIVAVEVGTAYNIAATKINKINELLPTGTTVINLSATTGGKDIQTDMELWESFQNKAALSDKSTNLGKKLDLLEEFPSINDIYIENKISLLNPVIRSNPEIKTYVVGENFVEVVETHVVNNSSVNLNANYIEEIKVITLNTNILDLYTLSGSEISINESTVDGDIINVTYTYNKLLSDLQIFLDNEENNIFNYKLNVYPAIKENLSIDLNIRLQTSFSSIFSIENMKLVVQKYYNTLYFTENDLKTDDLAGLLKNEISGVAYVEINSFSKKNDNAYLAGFPILVAAPRYPWLELDDIEIAVLAG